MAFVSNYEGAMLIEISGQEMDATIVDANGTDRDKFRITKAVPEPEQALLSLAAVLAVLLVKLKSGRGRARA
jgi:hypothetical protein